MNTLKLGFAFCIISVSVALIALCLLDKNSDAPLPVDTILRHKDVSNEENARADKYAFFEKMHNAAPDVDWRSVDHETRKKKYLQKLSLNSLRSSSAVDSFANGYLIGTWKEKGSRNQSGRIVYADIDTISNDLYCASAGGTVWKGSINGNNWTPLNDQMRFRGIIYLRKIINNANPDRLLCAANKYVYYSDDDGSNWQTSSGLTNVVSWGGIKRVMQLSDSARTIIALVQEWDFTAWNQINSLYKSIDQGASFTKMFDFDEPTYGNSNNFSIYVPYHSRNEVFLLNDTTLYSVNVDSNNYNAVSNILVVSHGRVMLTGSKSFGVHHMYAYVDGYIYKSTDAGANWTYASQLAKNPFSRNSFATSLLDPDKLYFGDIECWVSSSAGSSWSKVNNWGDYYSSPSNKLHADIPAIISLNDANGNELTFICTDGGIYVSTNQGSSVANLSLKHLNVSQYYSVYTHKNQTDYIYAGAQDQGFQRCQQDSGTVLGFDQLISGDYGHIVSSNRGESIWMVYPGFADFYVDAKNSNHTKSWSFNGVNDLWMPPLVEDPTNPERVYLAGGDLNGGSESHIIHLIYNSLTNSISPTQLPYDFKNSSGGVISAMSYSPLDWSHWYVATDNGKFFHSSDSGSFWTMTSAFTGPSAHYFYGSSIHPSQRNPGTLFIAGSGYSNDPVFRSDDHGQTFTSISNGLPPTLVYDIVGTNDDSLLFAATEVGPYVYVMRDNQWYDLASTSAPDQVYWSVEYVQLTNTIRFGTYGRGIWDFKIENIYVGKDDIAIKDNLISIYPNPSSDHLIVNSQDFLNSTELRIFDMNGNLHMLIRAPRLKQEIVDISKLSTGTYLLDVSNSDTRFTRKFIKN